MPLRSIFTTLILLFTPLLVGFKGAHLQLIQARDALSLEKPESALRILGSLPISELDANQLIAFHSLSALANKNYDPKEVQIHLELLKSLTSDPDYLALIHYHFGDFKQAAALTSRKEMKRLCQIKLARQAILDHEPLIALEIIKNLLIQEPLHAKQQTLQGLKAYSEWDSQQTEALQKTWEGLQIQASKYPEIALRVAWVHLKHAETLEGEAQRQQLQQAGKLLGPLMESSEYSPEASICTAAGLLLIQEEGFQAKLETLLQPEKFKDQNLAVLAHLMFGKGSESSADTSIQAHFLTLEGHQKRHERDWNTALACYQRSTELTQEDSLESDVGNEFWIAECERCLGLEGTSRYKFEKFYQNHPQHPLASEALFKTQSLNSYLQGDAAALKQLRQILKLYPESPISVEAHFFLAHDRQHTRYDSKSKTTRFRNLPEAIEGYSQAETAYELLREKNCLPEQLKNYYAHITIRAKLERAACHLEVAKESQGWKKKLTLEFAEEILTVLTKQLEQENLIFETTLLLAEIYELKEQFEEAEQLLLALESPSDPLALFQWNYQLATLNYQLGAIDQATVYFSAAESHLPEHPNTEGTKLDLWLKQGICCRLLNKTDAAMRYFSRIINTSNANPHQAEALFHRALLFWENDQHLLSIKQMERLASDTDSVWSAKAAHQLEIFYESIN